MIKKNHFFIPALMITILLIVGLFSGCEIQNDAAQNSQTTEDVLQQDAVSSINDAQYSKDYPIVLLHGFLGWGRDEVGGSFGHYHWGGYDDLQEILKSEGHDCYTAVVGPFSSNWDRACELYAQLKGVKTDYGLAHSQLHRHDRYGRDYSGKALLKDWGKPGCNQKIHIVAHSQGGHTAAMLAQLLENGFDDEKNTAYPADEPISPLFTGEAGTKNKIRSITTMAAPLNGTTLANSVLKLVPMLETILVNVISAIGIDSNDTFFNIYDFKLQQFGLKSRQHGEKPHDYMARMKIAMESFLGGNRKDTCVWDLSPEGAREQNKWVHAQSNIYYFSFAGESSHKALLPSALDNWEKYQVPDLNNPILLAPMVVLMGTFTCNDSRYHGLWRAYDHDFFDMHVSDRPRIDSSWWVNDGVVNTKSMNGPWLYPVNYSKERDVIVNWDKKSTPAKGVWNYGGVFTNVDHWDITGMEIFWYDRDNFKSPEFTAHAEDWYLNWADFLNAL